MIELFVLAFFTEVDTEHICLNLKNLVLYLSVEGTGHVGEEVHASEHGDVNR